MTNLTPFGTTILQAPGLSYRLSPISARIRLGVSASACEPLRWLIANEGCAAVNATRHGLSILVSPKALTGPAQQAVNDFLLALEASGRGSEPIAVKLYDHGSWRAHHVGSAVAAIDAVESACRTANATPVGSYIQAEPVTDETVMRVDERLYSLVRMHRIHSGRLRPSLMPWLSKSGLIDYVMFSTYEPRLHAHVVKHVGDKIDYNGREWNYSSLGRPLQTQIPDRVFGQFTRESLRGVEATREPVMTGVDLAVNTLKGVLRTRFVRVLLPFEAPDNRVLIVGASSWTFRKAA